MNSGRSLFTPIEKVIFSGGKEKGTRGGNELIKLEKSKVLFCITKHQYKFLHFLAE